MSDHYEDLKRAAPRFEHGATEPDVYSVDNTTGAATGQLAEGQWCVKASQDVFMTRGPSGLAGTDVKKTLGGTPDTDFPIFGGETIVVNIQKADLDLLDRMAFLTNAGTAFVWVWKKAGFEVK